MAGASDADQGAPARPVVGTGRRQRPRAGRAGGREPGAEGRVSSVNTSSTKGVPKEPRASVRLVAGLGVEGDAHASPDTRRQVSLLSAASLERMRAEGADVGPGDMAENVTVEGLEVRLLPMGARLRLGPEAVVEVTQVGKECHEGCAVRRRTGRCAMPTEGVFARVVEGGVVRPGDEVEVLGAPKGRGSSRARVEDGERAR